MLTGKSILYTFKLPLGVGIPCFWREKIVEKPLREGWIDGFETLDVVDSVHTEMLEPDIPVGGEAPYR